MSGRRKQENGFIVAPTVLPACGGDAVRMGGKAVCVGRRIDGADFFRRHLIQFHQFALHHFRMRHDGFGRGVVAAVAADGQAVDEVGLLPHRAQVAQMVAAANVYVGMVGGVAGNQVFVFAADAVELAGEKKRPQFFRDFFLVD